MDTRTLGTTNIDVSRMGVGLAALGRPGYMTLGHADDLGGEYEPAKMEARLHSVLDCAWEAGVRCFDAARSYGRAEEFLGTWLRRRKIPVDQVFVSSKWGYIYRADWQVDADVHEVKEHSVSNLRRQLDETLERLGNYLKLYQVHSATFDSGVLDNHAVLGQLAELKAAGTHVGLTLSGPQQAAILQRSREITYDSQPLFEVVQATFNLFETSCGAALADAHRAGVGVIVKEGLANGRLTARNHDPQFQERLDILRTEAERLGTEPSQLALSYILEQSWTDVVLSGAARIDHLQSNLGALDVAPDAEAHSRLGSLAYSSAEYWSMRDGFAWG
jgi:aryl-alcohol dehydrogenase-like predicted oxidoreductase